MAEKVKTRDKIIQVAIELFAHSGFQGTTFQEIARRVGISQPGIFIHFKNKMLLFEAVREFVGDHNRAYVDQSASISDNAYDALVKHCARNLTWVLNHPEYAQIILLLYYFGNHEPHLRNLNSNILERGEERILKHILAGEREALWSPADSKKAAEQIHSYLIGQSIKALYAEKKPSDKEVRDKVILEIEAVLLS